MILLLKMEKQNGGRKIARKLRDWYPGAIYHIMRRGVRRKPIFEDEMDHQVLLQIIKTSLSKRNIRIVCKTKRKYHQESFIGKSEEDHG